MAIETMSYRSFTMRDGRTASGCISIIAETGRLEGVRLRLRDSDENVREYLTPRGRGQSFRSTLSGEEETRPQMVRILREAFDQWFHATSL